MTGVGMGHTKRHSVHVGRQPIYDRDRELVGYELLFRGGPTATKAARSGAQATSQVIVNMFAEFGMEQLTGRHLAFINLTREFLTGELPLPFDPQGTVLEILETVDLDDDVVEGVHRLVQQGFTLALDDFVFRSGHERLMRLATYVKLEVLGVPREVVAERVAACREYGHLKLVAERLEDEDDLRFALDLGFDMFQGYALGRAQVLSLETLTPSRVRHLELVDHLAQSEIDVDEVAMMVATDPALSFRVLRATNSASAGLRRKVSSVHDALMLLGMTRLRHWLALMLLSDIAESDEEHVSFVLVRARLCQALAEGTGVSGDAAFTAGLVSGLADLLNAPPAELVSRLSLDENVSGAVVDGLGRLGSILGVVREYEAGGLPQVSGKSDDDLVRAYLSAVDWTMRTVAAVRDGE